MGRSFWILDDISTLHSWEKSVEESITTLFKPRDTHRFRYRSFGRSDVPDYPPSSVIIDYFLANEPSVDVTIDVLNSQGKVVRSYSSTSSEVDDTQARTNMATGFFMRGGSNTLNKSVGTHRFRWDFRHSGAWHNNPKRAFRNGPMAAPGGYTVRMTVDRKEYKQTFQLMTDPRIKESGVTSQDLIEQENLALQVRDLLTNARKLAEENSSNNLSESYQALVTDDGPYPQPMLVDQIQYLASMIDQADQLPGKDAYDRFKELKEELELLMK